MTVAAVRRRVEPLETRSVAAAGSRRSSGDGGSPSSVRVETVPSRVRRETTPERRRDRERCRWGSRL
ncbi:hypothetical protein EA472_06635 [Natrarchaeobius oligotrophus]|uniref:Uncharacterized protein n=1 Tax=Natrarchaeobius chitinivorans TaxID=1679083 RepID=A0A3N6MZK8_NATCH|nr:hypothetical protein EA472_06635 [Natrarchaeobius chitinivorans]